MDQILKRLQALISDLHPDRDGKAQVPTERELAVALGVHRTTLRERLAVLEILGVIRRAQGSGTYLALPDPGFVQFYFEMALKLRHVTTQQLEQAREAIELQVARLAALNATSADIAALESSLQRIVEATSMDSEIEADQQFHFHLARASHNPVIMLIMEGLSSVLQQVFRERRKLFRRVPGGSHQTKANHAAIVKAIRDRDPIAAVAAMDHHFKTWNQAHARITVEDGARRDTAHREE